MLQENLTLVQVKSIKLENLPPKYQDVLVNDIRFSPKKRKIVGITPAMPSGSSLKFMMDALPERAFDGNC
jgi:1-deoxy-D-xylulose-5-phosphate synthase